MGDVLIIALVAPIYRMGLGVHNTLHLGVNSAVIHLHRHLTLPSATGNLNKSWMLNWLAGPYEDRTDGIESFSRFTSAKMNLADTAGMQIVGMNSSG